MSITKAAMDGKLPCLVCVPEHLREVRTADDFGHKPIPWLAGQTVCARCKTRSRRYSLDEWGNDHSHGPYLDPVLWPCTSAIVLGLVPRNTE
ncbi:hypothetical protein HZZ00_37805 (plasmid) [Streptomyces sp. NEAU-sy36]|uniref:hypothetical protein n=1 Tax=unclassified Streptomyces TaxID=2593676 RepID=UPI0015D57BC2|nr:MULTISPECIES: hypothetical protein [unclassified Streptomyces]QLJ06787.1 hypothetical protein HZZ00_37805 [Streptomyces sp. NEAU-sy36]